MLIQKNVPYQQKVIGSHYIIQYIIQQALEQLSPQRRKVFEMKVSGKYSNQEIADKLNLSINTIKFQYSQSLKQIRSTVGELSLLLVYCII